MLGFGTLGQFALGEFARSPVPGGIVYGQGGNAVRLNVDGWAAIRARSIRASNDRLHELIRRLASPPPAIAEAVQQAQVAVERIAAPAYDYDFAGDQRALDFAASRIAHLERLIARYEDEEDDEDTLLLLS